MQIMQCCVFKNLLCFPLPPPKVKPEPVAATFFLTQQKDNDAQTKTARSQGKPHYAVCHLGYYRRMTNQTLILGLKAAVMKLPRQLCVQTEQF